MKYTKREAQALARRLAPAEDLYPDLRRVNRNLLVLSCFIAAALILVVLGITVHPGFFIGLFPTFFAGAMTTAELYGEVPPSVYRRAKQQRRLRAARRKHGLNHPVPSPEQFQILVDLERLRLEREACDDNAAGRARSRELQDRIDRLVRSFRELYDQETLAGIDLRLGALESAAEQQRLGHEATSKALRELTGR
ncbi:MAG TPA: hypothetical protein VLF67_01635 [Candidatus Saccharimonas sp.]|nr:hypothetical protein [Candidatus Saccharimonas sp.]